MDEVKQECVVSQNMRDNNVSSKNQVDGALPYYTVKNGGKMRILFVGNSITWHKPAPSIGWHGDWGMAASSLDKDYVHVLVSLLEQKHGRVDYCVAQLSAWERAYTDLSLLEPLSAVRDFAPDVIVIRLTENMPEGSAPASRPYFEEMIRYFRN